MGVFKGVLKEEAEEKAGRSRAMEDEAFDGAWTGAGAAAAAAFTQEEPFNQGEADKSVQVAAAKVDWRRAERGVTSNTEAGDGGDGSPGVGGGVGVSGNNRHTEVVSMSSRNNETAVGLGTNVSLGNRDMATSEG